MTQEDINALEIKHLKELIAEHEKADEKALDLAKQYYDLNHEMLAKDVEDLKAYKNNQQGKSAVWSIIVPALISLGIGLLMWKITGI